MANQVKNSLSRGDECAIDPETDAAWNDAVLTWPRHCNSYAVPVRNGGIIQVAHIKSWPSQVIVVALFAFHLRPRVCLPHLPSRAAAAFSRKALKSLICFNVPP